MVEEQHTRINVFYYIPCIYLYISIIRDKVHNTSKEPSVYQIAERSVKINMIKRERWQLKKRQKYTLFIRHIEYNDK